MVLLYPFLTIDEGIKSNVLGKDILFKFILPPIPKEIYSLDNTSIIKEIVKERIYRENRHLLSLKLEIIYERIANQLTDPILNHKIKVFRQQIEIKICSNLASAFWHRQRHIVQLPYEKDFIEKQIPTKARTIQMTNELLEHCKKEIEDLLIKGLIRKSKSPWSSAAFYVNKQAELERGVPRLVINYKPLNKALQWIRYLIPNKKDLLDRLHEATIFSKFDMKSGFWQIQINKKDKYKTTFTIPFGHYEWNVMPFGLKNAPSEFQNIMNDIFTLFTDFSIVYIDDVLIFSKSINDHWKHLNIFVRVIKQNRLVVLASKISLFQDKIRFLGHNIYKETLSPIDRAIQFANKFPDEIKDKN